MHFDLLTTDAHADYEPEVSGMMVDDTVRMTHHPKSRDLAIADFKVGLLLVHFVIKCASFKDSSVIDTLSRL